MTVEGEQIFIMKNHVTGAYYDLSEIPVHIWNLVDGKRTIAEISEELERVWEDQDITVVRRVLLFYAEQDCLKSIFEPAKKKRISVVSAFEVRICVLERSKALIQSVHKGIRTFLRRPLLWASLAFIALCAVVFAPRFAAFLADKSNFEIAGSSVVGFFFYFFIILLPVIIIHEIAHGLALVHYGGTPEEMGTGFFYFGPMFYINTTDSWMLERWQRMMVSLAGPLSTLLIGSALIVTTSLGQFPSFFSHVLTMAGFFCFYSTLADFAPPFETDGYYVLRDLVNNQYLREESYGYVKTLFTRLLRRSVKEKSESFDSRKKAILLVYAFFSIGWIVYLAYQSLTILMYMTEDVFITVTTIGSAMLFGQLLTITTVIVGVASILYFGMTVAGYGLILVAAVKKALIRTLPFEVIHDRDLSVFLHLPTQASQTLVDNLKEEVTKVAREFTLNCDVKSVGTQCLAVLRMGGVKLALVQIREHLRKVEEAFSSMYQRFLLRHKHEIYESVGIHGQEKTNMTALLREMGDELASAGRPGAKDVVNQIIERESKTALYLLTSAFGKVWTIELPPTQQKEMLQTMLPTFYVEDLTIADLYDETEEFKKRIIYGFDSIAKLVAQNQKDFQKVLLRPDKYQVVCFFEPVKSRLIFVGRTEEIEEDLSAFGSLFLCQAWCSYLDNLLTETNYALSMFSRTPFPSEEALVEMKDGELNVLTKNLSGFIANKKLISESLDSSEAQLQFAASSQDELKRRLKPTGAFEVGLLDAIFDVNTENLRNLPKQFRKFRKAFGGLCYRVEKINRFVERELQDRKPSFLKQKRKALITYPILAISSVVLAVVGFQSTSLYTSLLFLISPFILHVAFAAYYLRLRKSFRSVGKYPSSAFDQIQLYVLALTQTVYRFAVTGNILAPTKISTSHVHTEIRRTPRKTAYGKRRRKTKK